MTKHDRKALSEDMLYHIQAWQQSKTSQKHYCQENNLTYHKFIYWLHKLREAQNSENGMFIPVKTRPATRVLVPEVELTYPNGVRLRLSPDSFEHISRLIRLV